MENSRVAVASQEEVTIDMDEDRQVFLIQGDDVIIIRFENMPQFLTAVREFYEGIGQPKG